MFSSFLFYGIILLILLGNINAIELTYVGQNGQDEVLYWLFFLHRCSLLFRAVEGGQSK